MQGCRFIRGLKRAVSSDHRWDSRCVRISNERMEREQAEQSTFAFAQSHPLIPKSDDLFRLNRHQQYNNDD